MTQRHHELSEAHEAMSRHADIAKALRPVPPTLKKSTSPITTSLWDCLGQEGEGSQPPGPPPGTPPGTPLPRRGRDQREGASLRLNYDDSRFPSGWIA